MPTNETRPPIAVYDACVLYDSMLRDFLLQLHVEGAVQARWSHHILDEYLRHLTANRPDLGTRVNGAPKAMAATFPGSLIGSYGRFLAQVILPDPDDRHVVAVALAAKASIIVTANIKDFPTTALAKHGLRAEQPDDFIVRLIGSDPTPVVQSVRAIRGRLRNPAFTAEAYLGALERHGLTKSVARIRETGQSL